MFYITIAPSEMLDDTDFFFSFYVSIFGAELVLRFSLHHYLPSFAKLVLRNDD